MDAKKIGANIARLRKEKNWTQKALAEKLNVIDKTISRWECGYGFPDITQLPEVAKVFGITIEELLGEPVPDEVKAALAGGKKRSLRVAAAIGLCAVLVLGAIVAALVCLLLPAPSIRLHVWEQIASSKAENVFVTAFGEDEMMSLELFGETEGKFICLESWVKRADRRISDCKIEGTFRSEEGALLFCADTLTDPGDTQKLATCESLGLEAFRANAERDADGKLVAVTFATSEYEPQTTAFGRWTDCGEFFSRTKGEICFERVEGALTKEQILRFPAFAAAPLNTVLPAQLVATMSAIEYHVGDVIGADAIAATLVYSDGTERDVTALVTADLAGVELKNTDTEVEVTFREGVVHKSAVIEIDVTYGYSWERAEHSDADQVYFTHYITNNIIAFGVLELYGDPSSGLFVYTENYGREGFLSAAALTGTYTAKGETMVFNCLNVLPSKKSSSRFYTSGGDDYYTAAAAGGGLSFTTASAERNFFGYYSDRADGTTFSRFKGEVFFERVNGALSERAASAVEGCGSLIEHGVPL